MSETNGTHPLSVDAAALRDEWIAAVNELVARVDGWCKEIGNWATRCAPKRITDKPLGTYEVPMLLMQKWDVKLLLEPISRFVAGADGRVDLYTMPEYDDVAVLTRENGAWILLRVQLGRDEWREMPLTRDNFKHVIETFANRRMEIGPEFIRCP